MISQIAICVIFLLVLFVYCSIIVSFRLNLCCDSSCINRNRSLDDYQQI